VPWPLDPQRFPKRVDEALDRQLAVSPLASLVLRYRPQHRPGAADDASFLSRRERRRGLDVEQSLDPGL
jgi:hypothetical protein